MHDNVTRFTLKSRSIRRSLFSFLWYEKQSKKQTSIQKLIGFFKLIAFFFQGGFYSDTLGYVAESCRRCPNGSYVPFHQTPGKSILDCKACPLGKKLFLSHNCITLATYCSSKPYVRRNQNTGSISSSKNVGM